MNRQTPESPWSTNVIWQLGAMLLSRTADQLANPKTVLTWVMGAIGAPVFLIGWLVPIRESLSMLPQYAMAAYIKSRPRRQPIWLFGAGLQGSSILGIALTAWQFRGALGGILILLCVVIFSIGRACCSIAGKDVLGKIVPKTHRGRVNGIASSGSGWITLALGLLGLGWFRAQAGMDWLMIPLLLSVLCWLLAVGFFFAVREPPSEVTVRGSDASRFQYAIRLIREDADFRNFLLARAMMAGSALAAPYLVLLSQDSRQPELGLLGGFVAAGALASGVSGWIWGRMADSSSRRVLMWASTLAGVASFGGVWLFQSQGAPTSASWWGPCCFLVLNIAHHGVRVGRKTYLVNLGTGNRRTDYVAISNSIIGAFLILLGGGISLLGALPVIWYVFLFGGMSWLGALAAWRLPRLEGH